MSTDPRTNDRITRALLSESAYERLRYERHSYLRQSVPRTLTLQSALLGVLALVLPIYGLYPETVAPFLQTTDPTAASPKVILLGVFGGGFQLLGATLLIGAAGYRLRHSPLSEGQAHTVLDVEDFARYVALGTGGLAILVTFLIVAVGLGGGETVELYVTTAGENPYAPSGFGVPVSTVGSLAFGASVAVFYAGRYLEARLDPSSSS